MNQLFSDRHNFSVTAFGCSFTVYGKPEPGGSKNAGQMKDGKLFVRDSNPKAKGWKQEIAIVAGTLMQGRKPYEGPINLDVCFYLARPKGHSGKYGVRASAPRYPIVRPDTTKLLRPLEDALSGILWGDDNQIVTQTARKRYCGTDEEPRVDVRMTVIV